MNGIDELLLIVGNVDDVGNCLVEGSYKILEHDEIGVANVSGRELGGWRVVRLDFVAGGENADLEGAGDCESGFPNGSCEGDLIGCEHAAWVEKGVVLMGIGSERVDILACRDGVDGESDGVFFGDGLLDGDDGIIGRRNGGSG